MEKHYMIVACRDRSEVSCADSIREKFGSDADVVMFFERVVAKPRHRKSAKPVECNRPVYPGYIFVWLDSKRFWVELKGCKHVFGVLSQNGVPFKLPKERLVPTMPVKHESATIKPGTAVRVFAGALQGVTGILVRNGTVELNMFGRITRVQISMNMLERIVA